LPEHSFTNLSIKQGVISPRLIDQIVMDDDIPVFLLSKLFAFTDLDIVDQLQQHFPVERFHRRILADALQTHFDVVFVFRRLRQLDR